MSETTISTKLITGLVRFSYAHVWEPTAIEEGTEKKYSVALIIPKTDTDTVDKIKAIVENLKEQAKVKNNGKLPVKFKTPLRDGDEERPDDESYAGAYFINCSSKTQPQIVGTERDVDNKLKAITNQADFYSGCFGRASINFFLFDTKGNKGIAAGLNNLQKLKDGDPLAGRSNADDDFSEDFGGADGADEFM